MRSLPFELNVKKHTFFFNLSRGNTIFGYKRYIRNCYVYRQVSINLKTLAIIELWI
jgi:hypothetical protein